MVSWAPSALSNVIISQAQRGPLCKSNMKALVMLKLKEKPQPISTQNNSEAHASVPTVHVLAVTLTQMLTQDMRWGLPLYIAGEIGQLIPRASSSGKVSQKSLSMAVPSPWQRFFLRTNTVSKTGNR